MKTHKFFGTTSREVLAKVKQALGDDAVIVSNRQYKGRIEIMAAAGSELEMATPPAPPAPVQRAPAPVAAVAPAPVRAVAPAPALAPVVPPAPAIAQVVAAVPPKMPTAYMQGELDELLRELRLDDRRIARGRLHQQALDCGVEHHRLDLARAREHLLHDRAAERDTHLRGQLRRVLRAHCVARERFDDRAHVADVHLLFQQVLEHALEHRHRQELRHEILGELRRFAREMLEELLQRLASEQFGGVRIHDL